MQQIYSEQLNIRNRKKTIKSLQGVLQHLVPTSDGLFSVMSTPKGENFFYKLYKKMK